MSVIVSLLAVLLFSLTVAKKVRETMQQRERGDTEFDMLTVTEQMQTAQRTNADLIAMEQLLTDLSTTGEDSVLCITMNWIGGDGKAYQYSLLCNGINTANEDMIEIAERESLELRYALSQQCQALAESTRSVKNCAKNDLRGELHELLRNLRSRHIDG